MSEAIQRFETLLQKNPENGLARFSLGKALYDANRFAEAKTHFETALRQKPEWMVVQILLGKCELALGCREQARAAFERGLRLAIDQHHEGPQAELEMLLEELKSC
ncbi:MAG: tetratricopeptide repeat protein [Verrucomicrobiales bacterium]|nr:tetratricopeptide repeat protein [Verrucomicrobiales bacterium]